MKYLSIFLSLIVLPMPVFALLDGEGYLSISDLLQVDNLLIIKVDPQRTVKPLYNHDQVKTYPVVCLKILKGGIAKTGEVFAVDCEHPLVDGQRYLLAGRGDATLGGKPWPLFMGTNSAIMLPNGLVISALDGKDTKAQLLLIIAARIKELEIEATSSDEEKERLKSLIESKETKPQPTNALYSSPAAASKQ